MAAYVICVYRNIKAEQGETDTILRLEGEQRQSISISFSSSRENINHCMKFLFLEKMQGKTQFLLPPFRFTFSMIKPEENEIEFCPIGTLVEVM